MIGFSVNSYTAATALVSWLGHFPYETFTQVSQFVLHGGLYIALMCSSIVAVALELHMAILASLGYWCWFCPLDKKGGFISGDCTLGVLCGGILWDFYSHLQMKSLVGCNLQNCKESRRWGSPLLCPCFLQISTENKSGTINLSYRSHRV